MTENAPASGSVLTRGRGFLSESIEELRKVHTPTREETIRQTWVVMLIVAFISICLFLLDLFYNWIMSKLIG